MVERDSSGRRALGRSTSGGSENAEVTEGSAPRQVLGRSTSAQSEPLASGSFSRRQVPMQRRGRGLTRLRRPRVRTILSVVILCIVVVPLCAFGLGWWQYSKIPTVDIEGVVSPRNGRSGTNYLIIGTDSRSGIEASDPNADAFLAGEVSGSRTDTIMVLHVNGQSTQIVSIPRDLWVKNPDNGEMGRINSTFAAGPTNLIKAVESLGIPVDQYLEINFVSFDKLVDSVGGITIDFPVPAQDDRSGLFIASAGPQRLDGSEALAFVRSRHYSELVDGKWRLDGTADIGRTERQRAFFTALVHEVSNERNPIRLLSLPGSAGSGMKRGSTLSYFDAIGLMWTLKDAQLQPVALPVTSRTTSGGADVLELQKSASTVINELAL